MKSIKNLSLLALSIAFLSLTSCVSAKKYESLQERNQQLNTQVRQLNKQLDTLKMNTTEALAECEKALEAREEKMKELEALVAQQQAAVEALHQEVCSALKCFTPEELSIEVREGKLYVSMSNQLLFPSGSDQVNTRGNEAIVALAQVMKNSDLEIMVEGHTDNVPIRTACYEDNWDLSVHRASSVTRVLVEEGIGAERIIPCGRSYFKPIATNETAEGRQQNRRTELVLAPKLDQLWELTEQPVAATK